MASLWRNGLIVNMLDQRVHKLTPEFMTYTIAKMGLWAMTQTAAQALAPGDAGQRHRPGPDIAGAPAEQVHFDNAARSDDSAARGQPV